MNNIFMFMLFDGLIEETNDLEENILINSYN